MQFPEPGELFLSKYRLEDLIGEGGFARVFRARDAAERIVAIKILLPDGADYTHETVARFNREVKIVGGLRDPHTVTMFESGRSPSGLLYMVFEHVPGRDLSELLEAHGKLGASETIHIMRQVLVSLREAHAGGLLHRDIKPENIRVFEYMGDPLSVKLLDFGIAKSPDRDDRNSITKTGELVGTPRYMSPEQLMAKPLTAASDIYSLGLVMFEMLLGREALGGNAWSDQLERLQSGYVLNAPELERLGAGLVRVLNGMSARDVAQRYTTADAVLHALDALSRPESASWSGERPIASRSGEVPILPRSRSGESAIMERPITGETAPMSVSGGSGPEARQRSTLFIVLGVVIAAVVMAGVTVTVLLKQRNQPPPPPPAARALPTALLKTDHASSPDPEPELEPERDAAPDAVTPDPGLSEGCGSEPPFVGFGEMRGIDVNWTAYVPKNYDPNVKHPVILVAYPDHIQPDVFIRQTRLDVLADKRGVIVASPRVGELRAWWESSDTLLLGAVFEASTSVFCVDRERAFLLGHNNGGRALERAWCEPWVTAVAYTSHRPAADQPSCEDGPPKPALLLSPLKTGHAPIEGGPNCYGSTKISLEAFEKRWRLRNACDGPAKRFYRHKRSECSTWTCGAALVACHLDGGLGWPGTGSRQLADWQGCDGTPADFPFGETVWSFFDSVAKDPNRAKPPRKR